MSYLNGLFNAFYTRLYENMPTGYTTNDLANMDAGIAKTIDGKHLVQSTALGLRQQTAADTARCIRQFFIHTVAIYVPNADRADRAGILTTASEIQTLFEKQEFDNYVTQTSDIDMVGKQVDSKFYRVDVNINGYFEEIL